MVAEINGSGGKAQSVVLDVTVADKVDVAMAQAEATFGPIHAVINNAGVAATKPALDQDERSWDVWWTLTSKGSGWSRRRLRNE